MLLPSAFQAHSSPHVKGAISTITIMRNVVYALLPALAFGIYCFGLGALLLVLVTTASCLLGEWLVSRANGQGNSLRDYSALITGLLLAMTLPASLPLWMAAVGGFVAIILGKCLFGGLGSNPLNPALVGRAFLMAAFPAALTTWTGHLVANRFSSVNGSLLTLPLLHPQYDGISGATPLGGLKFSGLDTPLLDLFLGVTGGSLGETSAVLILLGGAYLALRRMLDWRIPTAIFATVILLGGGLHWWNPELYPSATFHLFSGGLMLGAVFMATDMVTSPSTPRGVWLYGVLIGSVVVVIRLWGGLPEGVMYAILLGNACRPLIERLCRPKPFGWQARRAT